MTMFYLMYVPLKLLYFVNMAQNQNYTAVLRELSVLVMMFSCYQGIVNFFELPVGKFELPYTCVSCNQQEMDEKQCCS